jgi:transcriptional regulator with XRE-family HTH domain
MNRWELIRYQRGLTHREVAEGSGVSLSTVIRLERNDQKPGAATVKALADFYVVSVAELLAEPDSDRRAA